MSKKVSILAVLHGMLRSGGIIPVVGVIPIWHYIYDAHHKGTSICLRHATAMAESEQSETSDQPTWLLHAIKLRIAPK